MSNTDPAVVKQRPAHLFKPGQSGNPAGRARGSRNRLADAFITDLRDAWEVHGVAALTKCATTDPSTFVKVIAGLMPKDINLNVEVDMQATLNAFRSAVAALGNEVPARHPKAIDARANRS